MKLCSIIFVTLLCGVFALPHSDGPKCQAPNGSGLTPILEEFMNLLPIDEILKIYLTAVSSDTEVQQIMEYLGTDEYLQVINAVTGSLEFAKLTKMACDELYLDVIYHMNVLNDILGLPNIPNRSRFSRELKQRAGFNGMLLDLIDVINVDALRIMFEEKSKTDIYVQKALKMITSQDFKNIIEALNSTPAYNKLLDDLRRMGVKVDEIIEIIRKYFE